jgi:EAL domain-containing protein (putative c-di-GMP-specific phosphodiesterase class I)
MISFNDLNFKASTLNELNKLHIDFAFQPIYDLETEEITAYEALMRPENETPLELIDRYESSRQLHIIELATFFGATMAYYERGYHEKFCVNSFPSEVFLPDEADLYFSHFPANVSSRLVLEVLEYPRFSPLYWHLKKKQIRNHGIEIALDDFGTGYNDYSSVSLVEPDYLKLDRCLISNIDSSPRKQKQLKEILEMTKALNIKVLAEGVETKEEYNYLRTSGACLAQGYYLGRPA